MPVERSLSCGTQRLQHRLRLVDAATPQRAIEHQPHAAIGRHRGGQCREPGGGIGQMMQHAAAIDVVEAAEIEARQIEQRAGMKADIAQATDLGAGFGDAPRGCREIEIMNFRRAVPVGKVLRQQDRRIAGAPARDQRAKRQAKIPRAGEDIVIDLVQIAGRSVDQPGLFILRIAAGIGIGFVLIGDRVAHYPVVSTILPMALRSATTVSAVFTSARS